MSKPTAVQWLIKELKDLGYYTYNLEKLCEQAKQMEKEQHEETWAAAWDESAKSGHFEKYYNETFGGEK